MCPNNLYFDTLFAQSGDVAAVPDSTQSNGSVSYTQGYGILYSTAVASGGYNFPRAQHNQVLHDITAAIQQQQQNGAPPFITTAMNGGVTPYSYRAGAIVSYDASDGSGTRNWISLQAANTTIPGAVGGLWAPLNNGVYPLTETATGYTYVEQNIGSLVQRSNSGTAMTDTLGGSASPLPANWFVYVENTDASANLTFAVGSGGSISVGSQYTANAFTVAIGETWKIISLGSGNYVAMRISTGTLHTRPVQGDRKNLAGVWASNTTATWTADGIVVYDASSNSRFLASFNKTLNVATSGAGGIDSGSIAASSIYHAFAIYNPASNTQNILASLSATAPTLPSGYPFFAKIGTFITDGSSHIIGFQQTDNKTDFKIGSNLSGMIALIQGNSGNPAVPTWTSVTVRGTAIPSTASRIQGVIFNADNSGQNYAAPNNSYGSNTSTTNPPPVGVDSNTSASGGSANGTVPFDFALQSNAIYYAASNLTGSDGGMYATGYTDSF